MFNLFSSDNEKEELEESLNQIPTDHSRKKEQIKDEFSKSDLNEGYNAYISVYQDYVDIVNQLDTHTSHKVEIERLEADHDRQDLVEYLDYITRAEERLQEEIADDYDISGHLYLVFLVRFKVKEMLKLLDLYYTY